MVQGTTGGLWAWVLRPPWRRGASGQRALGLWARGREVETTHPPESRSP